MKATKIQQRQADANWAALKTKLNAQTPSLVAFHTAIIKNDLARRGAQSRWA